jgi:hypothetical protein
MITMKHPIMPRSRAIAPLVYAPLAGAAVATMMLVSACGAGTHTAGSGHPPSAASAARQTCLQVDAVLSDGPDPGADPLGYAEAQIRPLEQIHAADPTLGTAIGTLAGAYQTYYAAHGTGSTITSTLNTAINRINALCPGAGATT